MVLSEDVWVIQMEGYLMKRGAGFKLENSEHLDGSSSAGTGKTKVRSRAASLIPRRSTLLRKGSGEKKRYFALVTRAPENGKGPRAELRYFATQRDPEAPSKGNIQLNVHMRVELYGHSTICLVTLGRTYYLRPDKSNGDPSSALARVTAGKWIHALQFAIDALRAWELAPSEDVSAALNPLTRLSIMISSEDLAKYQETLRRALQSKNQASAMLGEPVHEITEEEITEGALSFHPTKQPTTNPQTRRNLLMQSAAEYSNLWDLYGLHAYNALVAHYGPVLIDMQRMHDHLQVSIRMSEAEIELYDSHSHKSQDVAVSEQRTTARMVMLVYKSFDKRYELVVNYVDTYRKEVLQPIEDMIERIHSELDSVVKYHHGTASNFERLYKGVYDMKQTIRELQVEYDNTVNLMPSTGLTRLGRSGRQSVARTPEVISGDIDAIRSMLVQTQNTLRKEESRHANRMKTALKSLHSLDVERLNLQAAVLKRMTEIENDLFEHATSAYDENSRLSHIVDEVQPSLDVEATSKRLLQMLDNA